MMLKNRGVREVLASVEGMSMAGLVLQRDFELYLKSSKYTMTT